MSGRRSYRNTRWNRSERYRRGNYGPRNYDQVSGSLYDLVQNKGMWQSNQEEERTDWRGGGFSRKNERRGRFNEGWGQSWKGRDDKKAPSEPRSRFNNVISLNPGKGKNKKNSQENIENSEDEFDDEFFEDAYPVPKKPLTKNRDNDQNRNNQKEEMEKMKKKIQDLRIHCSTLFDERNNARSERDKAFSERDRAVSDRDNSFIEINRSLSELKKSTFSNMVSERKKRKELQNQIQMMEVQNKSKSEEIKKLKKELEEGKIASKYQSNPVPFSFFEDKESLSTITNIELLKRILKKNEMDVQNTHARVLEANERIRDRISELKMGETLREKEKIIEEQGKQMEAAKREEIKIKKQMEEKKEQSICNICFEREKDVTLVPCGHTICKICVHKLSKSICPICRQGIKTIQKFYL